MIKLQEVNLKNKKEKKIEAPMQNRHSKFHHDEMANASKI